MSAHTTWIGLAAAAASLASLAATFRWLFAGERRRPALRVLRGGRRGRP